MDEIKIKELWQSSNKKLEESFSISKKNTEDITKMKVQSLVSSMKPIKIFAIIIGLLWVGAGSTILINLFINAFKSVSSFFLFSASLQIIITIIALVTYVYQMALIHQVDVSKPIVDTQQNLARLKSSTLWIVRILFLQLPLWTTFYLSKGMFQNGNIFLLIVQGIVTFSFTYMALWLFFNIKYENKDKRWFRLIFGGKEWTPIIKSMELYTEIEEFKQGG